MYLFAVEASSFTYISNVLYKQWCRSFSLRTQAMYTKRIQGTKTNRITKQVPELHHCGEDALDAERKGKEGTTAPARFQEYIIRPNPTGVKLKTMQGKTLNRGAWGWDGLTQSKFKLCTVTGYVFCTTHSAGLRNN